MKNSTLLSVWRCFVLLFPVLLFPHCEDVNDSGIPDNTPTVEMGEQIWSWETPVGEGITSCPAIGEDGTIYAVTGDSAMSGKPARLYAINRDGSTRWFTDPLDRNAASSDVAIGPDGTIYVVGLTTLYAIDAYIGLFKWTWEPPDPHAFQIGDLAIGEDNTVYCSNIDTGNYHRAVFAVKHGYLQWKYTHHSPYSAIHLMVSVNGHLNLLWRNEETGSFHVESFQPSNGTLLWSTELNEGQALSLQDYGNGTLLAATASPDRVYWIDGHTGSVIQEKAIAAQQISIGTNGNLYTFVPNSGLTVYNGSGEELWSVSNGWSGQSGVALTEDNKALMFGYPFEEFDKGNLQCFFEDGTFQWSYATGETNATSAPLITSKGRIYVYGGWDPGILVCLKGNKGLAKTGWPRPQHDNKNTRNANLW